VGKCSARKCSNLCVGEVYLKDYGVLSTIAVNAAKDKSFKTYVPKERHEDYKILSVGGSGCQLSCFFCLPKDSLISTPVGAKRIDQIEDGEEIFALDNSSSDQRLVLAHVGHVFDRESEEVIVIEVDGGKLELTPEHPVMTKSRGWVKAADLTSDDEVLCDKTCL
jgi:hypothetical protein